MGDLDYGVGPRLWEALNDPQAAKKWVAHERKLFNYTPKEGALEEFELCSKCSNPEYRTNQDPVAVPASRKKLVISLKQ